MYYVTQTKGIVNLPEMQDDDKILVFYKATDTIKMGCVPMLLKFPLQLELIEDRDDMLVFLGGWFVSHDDDVTILDSTIPIPKRYANRIHKMKQRTVKTTKRTTKSKKEKKLDCSDNANEPLADESMKESISETVESVKTQPIETVVSGTNDCFMNDPEDEPINDVCAKELFDLIQITAKDASFSFTTEMFMLTLLSDVVEAAHNSVDLKQKIIYRKQGDLIWSKMEPCLDQIWKIGDRFETKD